MAGDRGTTDGVIQVWDAADREDQRFIEFVGWRLNFAAVEKDGRDSLVFWLLVLGGKEVSNIQLPYLSKSRTEEEKKNGQMCLMRKSHKREKAPEVVGPGPSPNAAQARA